MWQTGSKNSVPKLQFFATEFYSMRCMSVVCQMQAMGLSKWLRKKVKGKQESTATNTFILYNIREK